MDYSHIATLREAKIKTAIRDTKDQLLTPTDDERTNHSSGAEARAEASFAQVFYLVRAYHLLAGLISVTFERRRYRHLRRARMALAAAAVESAWSTWAVHRRGAYDRSHIAVVEAVLGAAGVAVSSSATAAEADQFNPTNFLKPLTLFGTIGVAVGLKDRRAALAATGLTASAFVASTSLRGRRIDARSLVVALQYLGCFSIGRVIVGRMRRTALEIESLRADAVKAASANARTAERERLQSDVQAGVVAALDRIRETFASDPEQARQIAQREAHRLRAFLRGTRIDGRTLSGRIEELIAKHTGSGVRLDVSIDVDQAPETLAGYDEILKAADLAIAAATHRTNADREHRATETPAQQGRVVVFASEDGHWLTVTVRDYVSSELTAVPVAPFDSSLEQVGGTIESSAGDTGQRVRLRLPLGAP